VGGGRVKLIAIIRLFRIVPIPYNTKGEGLKKILLKVLAQEYKTTLRQGEV